MDEQTIFVQLVDAARAAGIPNWRAVSDYDRGRLGCARQRFLGRRVILRAEFDAVVARMQELKLERSGELATA